MQPKDLYDLIIIGGGPAGLYSTFYAGMRDLKVKLIEYNNELGGKILFYPEKIVWDVGGMPPTPGAKLVEQLVNQANTFDPTICLNEHIVQMIREVDNTYTLINAKGEKHYTRTVMLASGHGIPVMQKLDIAGAERYEVSNLHYTVTQIDGFKDKRVLISGGGNAAVDWANELVGVAKEVIVCHRRDDFGGHEKNVVQMRESAVRLKTPFQIKELHGIDTRIDSVTLSNCETELIENVQIDAVIVNHGMKLDGCFLIDAGLELETDGFLKVSPCMETSQPGIFAAGDVTRHAGKLQLISGAFVEGATAVNGVKQYLDPSAADQAFVSSHNEKFKQKNEEIQLGKEA
ncbi:NAD(P)/FAD-dependent oxidoreductase [Bacillus sp. JCM 19041]|uniref:NAD(P)/FAD-dependent oxidoreductase n=1 Tax=Bacillus sp. JCM 19041 TaxID=1460637 RepID=UPI0006D12B09